MVYIIYAIALTTLCTFIQFGFFGICIYLYEKKRRREEKQKQKQTIIEIMQFDEKIGLYDNLIMN